MTLSREVKFSETRCGWKQRTCGIRNTFSSRETGNDRERNKSSKNRRRKSTKRTGRKGTTGIQGPIQIEHGRYMNLGQGKLVGTIIIEKHRKALRY